MADISATNWNETDANNNTAPPDGFPFGMLPSGENTGARAVMGATKRWWNRMKPTTTDSGGTLTAYTLTYSVAPASYVDGETYLVRFDKTCGNAPTLNIMSLGAAAIYKYSGGAWVACAAGDITAAMICRLSYNLAAGAFFITSASSVPADFLTGAGDNVLTGDSDFTGGTIEVPTRPSGNSSTSAASTAFVVGLLRSYLSGLTLSAAGGSATFGIAVGLAADSTDAAVMALASAYTKTTGAWAVGTGNGSLDTSSIAINTWYHVWLIMRPDTGVVDVLASLSATSPTMPANYTLKRRIGSMKTDGSAQWVAFIQEGDLFQWLTFVASNSTDPGTPAVSRTLAVPTGINVLARIQPIFINLSTGGPSFVRLSDLATTDTVPSASNSDMPGANNGSGQLSLSASVMDVRTNTSAQIRARLSYSDGSVSLNINTLGWIDRRGRDA